VSLWRRALELEEESIAGRPRLGEAYELLLEHWRAGNRDRDLALHLMFLAWYLSLEPVHLTGLDESRTPSSELPRAFNEAHDTFASTIGQDAEMLFVVGVMARICPWCLGDVHLWDARSAAYRIAYRRLAPNGISPLVFEGRGYYGDYFAGQARVKRGF